MDELIKLADELDKHGEHEKANEIDALIEKEAVELKQETDNPIQEESETSEQNKQLEAEDDPLAEYYKREYGVEGDEKEMEKWKYVNHARVLADKLEQFGLKLVIEPIEQPGGESEEEMFAKRMSKNDTLNKTFGELTEIADKLDSEGAVKEANLIDNFLKKHAMPPDVIQRKERADTDRAKVYDSAYHRKQQLREPEKGKDYEGRGEHHVESYQESPALTLSTRTCPDHPGVQLGRVGERQYMCSLDNKVYNYDTGWKDYSGEFHPGFSVSNQTPTFSQYSTPSRIFDTRENVLNTIH